MEKSSTSNRFIFATILLDALGIGLLIPILPDVIRRFGANPEFVNQYYGYFISVYALMQFVASPVLGSLSDRYGRRPVLLVSLLGSGLDYLLMAFAPNLWILFLGRVIAGLTGASMTVASSYMADISDDSNRSANFGLIGAGWGVGFIAGPMLGGLLGAMNPIYPFIAAAVLNLLNFAFGYFILPESLPPERRRKIETHRLNPLSSLKRVFTSNVAISLVLVYTIFHFAGQAYPSTWTLYAEHKFGWSAFQVGLSLSLVGVCMGIVQGMFTKPVIARLGEERALSYSMIINVLGFVLIGLATHGWMVYAIFIATAPAALGGPAIHSLISKNTPSSEQGELQGSLMSVISLTAIAAPLLYTDSFARFTSPQAPVQIPGFPYYLAGFMCFISLVIFHFRKKMPVASA